MHATVWTSHGIPDHQQPTHPGYLARCVWTRTVDDQMSLCDEVGVRMCWWWTQTPTIPVLINILNLIWMKKKTCLVGRNEISMTETVTHGQDDHRGEGDNSIATESDVFRIPQREHYFHYCYHYYIHLYKSNWRKETRTQQTPTFTRESCVRVS